MNCAWRARRTPTRNIKYPTAFAVWILIKWVCFPCIWCTDSIRIKRKNEGGASIVLGTYTCYFYIVRQKLHDVWWNFVCRTIRLAWQKSLSNWNFNRTRRCRHWSWHDIAERKCAIWPRSSCWRKCWLCGVCVCARACAPTEKSVFAKITQTIISPNPLVRCQEARSTWKREIRSLNSNFEIVSTWVQECVWLKNIRLAEKSKNKENSEEHNGNKRHRMANGIFVYFPFFLYMVCVSWIVVVQTESVKCDSSSRINSYIRVGRYEAVVGKRSNDKIL